MEFRDLRDTSKDEFSTCQQGKTECHAVQAGWRGRLGRRPSKGHGQLLLIDAGRTAHAPDEKVRHRTILNQVCRPRTFCFENRRAGLNHYPMRSWDGRFHGVWHLYGHVHDRLAEADRKNPTLFTKDVGVDACEYQPIGFEQLQAYMRPRIEAFGAAKARFVAGDAREGESVD